MFTDCTEGISCLTRCDTRDKPRVLCIGRITTQSAASPTSLNPDAQRHGRLTCTCDMRRLSHSGRVASPACLKMKDEKVMACCVTTSYYHALRITPPWVACATPKYYSATIQSKSILDACTLEEAVLYFDMRVT